MDGMDGLADSMKLDELIVLGLVSAALLAGGIGYAWLMKPRPAAEAPAPVIPQSTTPEANPFDRFDVLTQVPKELGFIDQWRFDSCMTDAAKNPTAHGVNTAARVCRRRFDQ